ncbi:MAG: cell division protein ZapA [Bacteroidales bacterium]|nr:cell division protein ZapA [Bacteroidales bacterium]
MDQSIKVIIGGKDYPLKASSPEMEHFMRIAAEQINQKLETYNAKYPDLSVADKLAFVCLQEAVNRLSAQKKIANMNAEVDSFLNETSTYLQKIETK